MIDHKTRDRALFQIMINEGWSREEVNELIATKDHVELDRLYNRLSADTERRARDVPISTDKGVISIHEMRLRAQSQRLDEELKEDEANFDRVSNQMYEIMEASGFIEHQLITATLRALMQNLDAQGIPPEHAKEMIIRTLTVMIDITARENARESQ